MHATASLVLRPGTNAAHARHGADLFQLDLLGPGQKTPLPERAAFLTQGGFSPCFILLPSTPTFRSKSRQTLTCTTSVRFQDDGDDLQPISGGSGSGWTGHTTQCPACQLRNDAISRAFLKTIFVHAAPGLCRWQQLRGGRREACRLFWLGSKLCSPSAAQ